MSCKRIPLLVALVYIFLSLTATAGFTAMQNNPGVRKIPNGQIFKPNPLITVTSPKASDIWMVGDDQGSRHISWAYSGNIGDKFNIALQKGTSIVLKFPGDFSIDGSGKGSAWVKIPDSVSGGDGYQIVVASKDNPNIKGVSPAFSLLNLRITSPKDGEVWYKGGTHNINWTYSGTFGPKVYIWLMSDDLEFVLKIGEASIGDKCYPWKITADIERRKNYKIVINNDSTYLLGGNWGSFSRGLFTVAEYVK